MTVPEKTGGKLYLYFKRYVPKGKFSEMVETCESIHDVFEQLKDYEKVELQKLNESEKEYPLARTLIVMNFEKPLNAEKVRKVYHLLGKIRKVECGSYKNKAKNSKFKNIHFALVVFKNEYDLIKCFDGDLLQSRIDEFFKQERLKQDSDGKDTYLRNLLVKYEENNIDEE